MGARMIVHGALSFDWSDEAVARLKRLWADGHSASQIAGEIGGITRNAVISKVHRLKLPPRLTRFSTPHFVGRRDRTALPAPTRPRPAAALIAARSNVLLAPADMLALKANAARFIAWRSERNSHKAI